MISQETSENLEKKCQATLISRFICPCDWGIMIGVESQILTLSVSFSAGPVYHEYCDCPEEDPEVWQNTLSCPSQEPQITKDFLSFPTIDLQRMLKEIPSKFSQTRGAIVHYTILNNRIYRRSLGKYTDFKMFSDEMLLSLARKVSVLTIYFKLLNLIPVWLCCIHCCISRFVVAAMRYFILFFHQDDSICLGIILDLMCGIGRKSAGAEAQPGKLPGLCKCSLQTYLQDRNLKSVS